MLKHDTPPTGAPPATILSSRMERLILLLLLVIFCAFTWKSTLMYLGGDDLMNTYEWAWTDDWKRMAASLVCLWMPLYRPLGEIIYKIWFSIWDFQPFPLYAFGWLLLIANCASAYRMFKAVTGTALAALIALTVVLVHGAYIDLYNSTGTNFDRLVFLFATLALTAYARVRSSSDSLSVRQVAWIWILCAMAMDSKESGVIVPVLLGLYELLIVLPDKLRRPDKLHRTLLKTWLASIAPLFVILGGSCLVFLLGRVARTPALVNTPNYHPQVSAAVWLDHMAQYLTMLTYRQVEFTPALAGFSLLALLLAGVLLRRRLMIFGWLWFTLSMLPVALIVMRPGYVLYVPALGLGLYVADLLTWGAQPAIQRFPRVAIGALMAIIGGLTAWHAQHWPGFPDPTATPIYRLADQFRKDFPRLATGSKVLFVTDFFGKDSWEMTFALRLLYHDPTLDVRRMSANPEMQPAKGEPLRYDLVLVAAGGRYEQLDERDIDESIRLHILKKLTVGRRMRTGNRDHGAYVVSGIEDFEGAEDGRWTKHKATLKFDVYPAESVVSVIYYVPEQVTAGASRVLSASVNGHPVGSAKLSNDGLQTLRFPVPASAISTHGFTLLDLTVDPPYVDSSGSDLGVLLMEAGFEYSRP